MIKLIIYKRKININMIKSLQIYPINYQKLIYINFYYGYDNDIQFYLTKIKETIADFWLNEQKIIARIKN